MPLFDFNILLEGLGDASSFVLSRGNHWSQLKCCTNDIIHLVFCKAPSLRWRSHGPGAHP